MFALKKFNAFVVVPVIVRDGDMFLLLEEYRFGKQTLNILGGRMDLAVIRLDTACCEAKEEMGIEAGMGAPIGVERRT